MQTLILSDIRSNLPGIGSVITMSQNAPGKIQFKSAFSKHNSNEVYLLTGYEFDKEFHRSAGASATGAIVGGVLTGGIGLLAGAAIGGRQKDKSRAILSVMRESNREEFIVEFNCKRNQFVQLKMFTLYKFEEKESYPLSFSIAGELLKFKELLDNDVISQEEFDQKKKELLNSNDGSLERKEPVEPTPSLPPDKLIDSKTNPPRRGCGRVLLIVVIIFVIAIVMAVKQGIDEKEKSLEPILSVDVRTNR